jgi:hypothetical protein
VVVAPLIVVEFGSIVVSHGAPRAFHRRHPSSRKTEYVVEGGCLWPVVAKKGFSLWPRLWPVSAKCLESLCGQLGHREPLAVLSE